MTISLLLETDGIFQTDYLLLQTACQSIRTRSQDGFVSSLSALDYRKSLPMGSGITFITLLISKGVDIVTVSNLAGHSMPSATINMYAHAVSERKASAAEAVGDLFSGMM